MNTTLRLKRGSRNSEYREYYFVPEVSVVERIYFEQAFFSTQNLRVQHRPNFCK